MFPRQKPSVDHPRCIQEGPGGGCQPLGHTTPFPHPSAHTAPRGVPQTRPEAPILTQVEPRDLARLPSRPPPVPTLLLPSRVSPPLSLHLFNFHRRVGNPVPCPAHALDTGVPRGLPLGPAGLAGVVWPFSSGHEFLRAPRPPPSPACPWRPDLRRCPLGCIL